MGFKTKQNTGESKRTRSVLVLGRNGQPDPHVSFLNTKTQGLNSAIFQRHGGREGSFSSMSMFSINIH